LAAWCWLTAKTMALADFAADRVAQRVLQKGLAEELVGGFGEEALLEFALLEVSFCVVSSPSSS
jgi:hypothetical protein